MRVQSHMLTLSRSCSPAKKPAFVQSGVPLRDVSGEGPAADQALFAYAVLGGDSAVIELPGADPENPDATLVFTTDTSYTLGSLILDSDSATATYTPPLSSNSSSDLFTYTVTSNSLSSPPATVRIIFVSPPTSRSFSTTIVEDRDTIVVLHRYVARARRAHVRPLCSPCVWSALHAHEQRCPLFTPPPPLFTRVCGAASLCSHTRSLYSFASLRSQVRPRRPCHHRHRYKPSGLRQTLRG